MTLTKDRIKELRAVCDAATKGSEFNNNSCWIHVDKIEPCLKYVEELEAKLAVAVEGLEMIEFRSHNRAIRGCALIEEMRTEAQSALAKIK